MLEQKSISGKIWKESDIPEYLLEKLVQDYSISPLVAKILINRKVDFSKIKHFLDPKLRNFMLDPYSIKDMHKAIEIIDQIILTRGKVYILGDYDVDGMSSTAILYKYLNEIGILVEHYIPNRFQEGYGGNTNSIRKIIDKKPNVVIMVDNGSSSIYEVEELRNNNIEVIILDHHATSTLMPRASALVNPNRLDDDSGLGYLCSAGLVFLFLVCINRFLKNKKFLSNKEINLFKYLDLVALATVCDMVPLIDLNRAYVVQGLKIMRSGSNLGIRVLLETIEFDNQIDTETIGFTIGPIINAASRMGSENLALQLLITDDENKAKELAIKMKELNSQRQSVEDQIINNALDKISKKDISKEFIFVGSENWSQGLVGIVSGRIKEIHNKPTCVYSIDINKEMATASGRSVLDIDLGSIVMAAKQSNLLVKGGGHSQAVGFSFELKNKEKIEEFFMEKIKYQLDNKQINCEQYIDNILSLPAINKNVIKDLSLLQPFGIKFQEPIFKINNVFFKEIRQIGKNKNHLTFSISDGYCKIKGLAFKAIPSKIGDFMIKYNNKPVNVIVSIKSRFYKGNIYPSVILVDII